MDKKEVIKEVYDKRKKDEEDVFKFNVEQLVLAIEKKSCELRALKLKLARFEYNEPEVISDLLDE